MLKLDPAIPEARMACGPLSALDTSEPLTLARIEQLLQIEAFAARWKQLQCSLMVQASDGTPLLEWAGRADLGVSGGFMHLSGLTPPLFMLFTELRRCSLLSVASRGVAESRQLSFVFRKRPPLAQQVAQAASVPAYSKRRFREEDVERDAQGGQTLQAQRKSARLAASGASPASSGAAHFAPRYPSLTSEQRAQLMAAAAVETAAYLRSHKPKVQSRQMGSRLCFVPKGNKRPTTSAPGGSDAVLLQAIKMCDQRALGSIWR